MSLIAERALHRLMPELAAHGLLRSAHDCSDGGLAVALAESCFMEPDHLVGATIQCGMRRSQAQCPMPHAPCRMPTVRPDALLFGESSGRIVVSCRPSDAAEVLAQARRHRVPAAAIGRVGGERLTIGPWIDGAVTEFHDAWRESLPRHLGVTE